MKQLALVQAIQFALASLTEETHYACRSKTSKLVEFECMVRNRERKIISPHFFDKTFNGESFWNY